MMATAGKTAIRGAAEQVALGIGEHASPFRVRRVRVAQAEKRQPGGLDHRRGQRQGRLDDDRGDRIGHDMREHDPGFTEYQVQ